MCEVTGYFNRDISQNMVIPSERVCSKGKKVFILREDT